MFLIQVFPLVLFFTFSCLAQERPNVLMIIVDDLGSQFETYGPARSPSGQIERAFTPNFNNLALEGTVFERAICQFPSCGPSRASFLSGLYPYQTGRYTHSLHSERAQMPWAVFLPQLFKREGYTTVGSGKVYHHKDYSAEIMDGGTGGPSWTTFRWPSGAVVSPVAESGRATGSNTNGSGGFDWMSIDADPMIVQDGPIAQIVIDEIESKATSGEPWMIVGGFYKPHSPWFAAKEFFDLYPVEEMELGHLVHPGEPNYETFFPGGTEPMAPTLTQMNFHSHGMIHPLGAAMDDLEMQQAWRAYFACVSHVDYLFGKVVEALKASGQYENTVIVLMSDHGYSLGIHEKRVWEKQNHFPQTMRTPLIISAPGHREPQRVPSIVELVDLYPTLLEICSLEEPYPLPGESLVRYLENPSRVRTKPAYCETETTGGFRGRESPTVIKQLEDPLTNENNIFSLTSLTNSRRGFFNWEQDPESRLNLIPFTTALWGTTPLYLPLFEAEVSKIPSYFRTENQIFAEPGLLDRDGDGLSDEDEIYFGSAPNVTDTDLDGFSDREEFVSQTDPRNAHDYFHFTMTMGDSGSFELSLIALQSRNYQLQWSQNLHDWYLYVEGQGADAPVSIPIMKSVLQLTENWSSASAELYVRVIIE